MELLAEFRRGIDQILRFPRGWPALDEQYRRYRLHKFPYGIVYRIDDASDQLIIQCLMHLSRDPDFWRRRA